VRGQVLDDPARDVRFQRIARDKRLDQCRERERVLARGFVRRPVAVAGNDPDRHHVIEPDRREPRREDAFGDRRIRLLAASGFH
jgi:hypothetical protein